ncbi:MAG: LpxL/LpxP family acyltransferase [Methylobacter sp.]
MDHKNKHFFDAYQWVMRFIASPPALTENYNTSDFLEFMRRETYLFSARYAKKYVTIHGQDKLLEVAAHSGILLAPVHYGSFFLSGGAIIQQLNLPYTAIVTGRNLAPLPVEEQLFWKGVHQRSSRLYQQPLFYTGTTPPANILNYLSKPGNLLCAMLDVRELGHITKEYPFNFLGSRIYLQTGPARLAYLAKAPILPMTIQYDLFEQRHHLYFGDPVYPYKDHVDVTQRVLSSLEYYIADQPQQWFHDIAEAFSLPGN